MDVPTFECIYYRYITNRFAFSVFLPKPKTLTNKDIKRVKNKDISYLESEKATSLLVEEINMPHDILSY